MIFDIHRAAHKYAIITYCITQSYPGRDAFKTSLVRLYSTIFKVICHIYTNYECKKAFNTKHLWSNSIMLK